MDVKTRLQELLDKRGWSVYKLAKESGVSWSTVRNMFKRYTDPSLSTLENICKGLGISLADFFDESSDGIGIAELTEEERRVLRRWNALNEKNKRIMLELLDSLNQK